LLLLSLLSCVPSGEDANNTAGIEKKGKIGTTCMDLTNPFFKLIANVMSEEAAKQGYDLVALDGALDSAKQNSQLSDFAAQGYDAVFLNPVDSEAVGEGIKKLHASGIPVFTFDIQVSAAEAKDLVVSHIGSDNYQGGQLAGASMIKAIGKQGKIAILGLPEVSSCVLRVNGFKDHLASAGASLEIVTELNGKGNRTDGFAVTNDILQAHPDIRGIFAINDPSGLGAYAAVAKANRTDDITIVAFDASPAGKQGVFEGKLFDTPQQFPRKMASGTVNAFLRYLEGDDVEKKIFIPCAHYDLETATNDETRERDQW
ncbi:MAG: substrate-binding domain-containing protein, partial [Verrucomicrobiota bacterium]